MKPQRIQLLRKKGWRMPPNTVKVDRSTKWGNPFPITDEGRDMSILRFACERAPLLPVSELRGKNLACWCKLYETCHADILLDIANA